MRTKKHPCLANKALSLQLEFGLCRRVLYIRFTVSVKAVVGFVLAAYVPFLLLCVNSSLLFTIRETWFGACNSTHSRRRCHRRPPTPVLAHSPSRTRRLSPPTPVLAGPQHHDVLHDDLRLAPRLRARLRHHERGHPVLHPRYRHRHGHGQVVRRQGTLILTLTLSPPSPSPLTAHRSPLTFHPHPNPHPHPHPNPNPNPNPNTGARTRTRTTS